MEAKGISVAEFSLSEPRHKTRPQIGSVTLSVLVALYLLFATNQTFWMKSAKYFALDLFALAALIIGLSAGFIALFTPLSQKFIAKPVFIFCILAAAAASWFIDRFGIVIDAEMIRNAVQTTPTEAGHLITPGFLWHMLIVGVVPALLVGWVEIRHRPFWSKAAHNLAVVLPCLIVFALAGYSHFKTFAGIFRQHRELAQMINPILPIGNAIKYAVRTTEEQNIVTRQLGTDAHRLTPVGRIAKPRVTIVVVGETARAANFSLGGYARATNPELSKLDVVYFPNTTSCGTATAVSVPCMFSVYPRQAYTHRKGLETENLTDVLAHAGINVSWWDNNTGSKQVADRIATVSLSDSGDTRFCTGDECRDGILLDRLDAWLDSVKQDSVLILHQIGSHGPAYYARYPEKFRVFAPDCRTGELSECSSEEIVNAYDNTILFTDHVLAGIIGKLEDRSDKMAGAMFYMSDHGESLGENGLYLHGAPYFIAPDVQTHVPFIVWMGKDFTASMGLDTACLAETANAPRSHDNLFHSVLGMMNVATSVYDPSLDVFAPCRSNRAS
ncbi:phosphoethanolamine transferase [Rhizobiaceae bacterium n13]|uniref:Phosphoethanolamine transferase n=1 Tax=Ferirhizobium litorale TaxID=2927786 RepID=A0AAE3QBH7_9HYPH|nr:phosphoethanolamine--lipid A transferase [Fererhizobium litorale]MDI7861688.1 phosphoethanolamine transferase [Fererhizobium litorale]MDI7921970.1 phosphoethanolamine transferase [Fererhizobium litorale]